MRRLAGAAIAALSTAFVTVARAQGQIPFLLAPPEATVVSIADSTDYYVYSYLVRNPLQSHAGIGVFGFDLSLPSQTAELLPPATGVVKTVAVLPGHGRVPVGPIIPPKYEGFVLGSGRLAVYDTTPGYLTNDSIAPGAALNGFGLRSRYLPGVRETTADPTTQACCSVPLPNPDTGMPCDTVGEDMCLYPPPDAFRVEAWTAPTYAPEKMNHAVLESLRLRSCVELDWISDQGVCGALQSSLTASASAASTGDNAAARREMDAFITQLHASHDSAGALPVNDNAYWMLLTNARHIRFKVLPPPACGEVRDLPFLAGQTTEAGRVMTWNDATNVYVKYAMAAGWQLMESHLAVALSIDGIPANKAENPVIGQFPYQTTHGSGTAEYTWTVPLVDVGAVANGELLIAAHGVVTGAAGTETAWAEGSRFTDQGNWAMYFTYVVTNCQ